MAHRRQRGRGQGSLFRRQPGGPWVASWFDFGGRRRTVSTKTTDKAAASRILAKHVADAALRREGVIDASKDGYAVEGRRRLGDHITAYLEHCQHAGQAPKHVAEKVRHLGRMAAGTGALRLSDLTADALERHLAGLRADGLSSRTCNFCRQVAVAFLSWCQRTGRVESNPLRMVGRFDESQDRRRVRRPLTDDELARLLAVAEAHGRRAWYLTAALAGLRRGELGRLTWADADLDQQTITLRGGKARRVDVIPMHPTLAAELRRLRAASMALPAARVFPQAVTDRTCRRDFERAGVAREDAEGRVADLHSLRTWLATNLARAGVTPQVAQRILRHGDYRTTLRHYTVLGLVDTAVAIQRLPGIEPAKLGQDAAGAVS